MVDFFEGFGGLIIVVSILLGAVALIYIGALIAREVLRIALPFLTLFGIILIVWIFIFGPITKDNENHAEQSDREPTSEDLEFIAYGGFKPKDDANITSDEEFEYDTRSSEFIENFVVSYGYEMVEAINYGDFSLVANFLYPNSPLEESQEKLVDRLYENGTTETVNTYLVENITVTSNEWAEVTAYEDIDVHRTDGTKNTAYYWKYKLKWNNDVGMYQMYSIHEHK